jgi:hypothetical protein
VQHLGAWHTDNKDDDDECLMIEAEGPVPHRKNDSVRVLPCKSVSGGCGYLVAGLRRGTHLEFEDMKA